MPPKILQKTPHGSIVQHDDGTSVLLPDHLAAALTADPVAPLTGSSAPPGAVTDKDKAVLQARPSGPSPAVQGWTGGGVSALDDAGDPGGLPPPAPGGRPGQKKYTPAQAIFAGLGTVGTALNGGGENPVLGQIDGQNLSRADKLAAAAGTGAVAGALPVYDPLTPVVGRPGQAKAGRHTARLDYSSTGSGIPAMSIVETLRAQGFTGAALENKLHEMGYNTAGFGGQ